MDVGEGAGTPAGGGRRDPSRDETAAAQARESRTPPPVAGATPSPIGGGRSLPAVFQSLLSCKSLNGSPPHHVGEGAGTPAGGGRRDPNRDETAAAQARESRRRPIRSRSYATSFANWPTASFHVPAAS